MRNLKIQIKKKNFNEKFLFSAALAFGAKESSLANNVFTIVNLSVVIFVIIAGAFKGKFNGYSDIR